MPVPALSRARPCGLDSCVLAVARSFFLRAAAPRLEGAAGRAVGGYFPKAVSLRHCHGWVTCGRNARLFATCGPAIGHWCKWQPGDSSCGGPQSHLALSSPPASRSGEGARRRRFFRSAGPAFGGAWRGGRGGGGAQRAAGSRGGTGARVGATGALPRTGRPPSPAHPPQASQAPPPRAAPRSGRRPGSRRDAPPSRPPPRLPPSEPPPWTRWRRCVTALPCCTPPVPRGRGWVTASPLYRARRPLQLPLCRHPAGHERPSPTVVRVRGSVRRGEGGLWW